MYSEICVEMRKQGYLLNHILAMRAWHNMPQSVREINEASQGSKYIHEWELCSHWVFCVDYKSFFFLLIFFIGFCIQRRIFSFRWLVFKMKWQSQTLSNCWICCYNPMFDWQIKKKKSSKSAYIHVHVQTLIGNKGIKRNSGLHFY